MIQTTLNGSNLPILQSQLLQKEAGIVHFSTMRGCSDSPYFKYNMCNYTGDSPEHVEASRKAYAEALGIDVCRMWFPRQVHGSEVLVVDSSMPDGVEADAVITNERNLLIGVSTADCVPVLLYDPVKGVIAAAHAGWRGTIANIVGKTVARMRDAFGSDPSDILAAIGPSISPEAFEVGTEVSDVFVQNGYESCVLGGYSKPHVDLWSVNEQQLVQQGVLSKNIDQDAICTFFNCDKLFSARRLGIKSGRIVTAIMLI